MTIEGTCGEKTANTLDELYQILHGHRDGDFREFWLGGQGFPAMAIHIHGDLAYLHFFPADKHPGFQPIGNLGPQNTARSPRFRVPGFQSIGNLGQGNDVTFKQKGQEDFSVPRTFIVTIGQAYQAAAEFFTTLQRPGCIQWTEL
jgi:hypothetical protein